MNLRQQVAGILKRWGRSTCFHHGLKKSSVRLKPIRNDGVEVNVAISYGGRREIVDAVKNYLSEEEAAGHSIKDAQEKLTAEDISKFLIHRRSARSRAVDSNLWRTTSWWLLVMAKRTI